MREERQSMVKTNVSVIVRTKNEFFWLKRLLPMLAKQVHCALQLVIVDNMSTFPEVKLAEQFSQTGAIEDVDIVYVEEYRPGLALNIGTGPASMTIS